MRGKERKDEKERRRKRERERNGGQECVSHTLITPLISLLLSLSLFRKKMNDDGGKEKGIQTDAGEYSEREREREKIQEMKKLFFTAKK